MRLRKLLHLSRSDRQVFLFLLCAIVGALVLVFFFGGQETSTPLTEADSIQDAHDRRRYGGYPDIAPRPYKTADGRTAELFAFDPNTADSTELLRLGLAPWQVRAVYKYRAKGGIFRAPEDFARLYGLTKKQYMDMRPYIRISDDYAPAAELVGPREVPTGREAVKQFERDTVQFPRKLKAGQTIDLATADTTLLKRVPGIGSWWAHHIVSYRERLGGYTSINQLREIEGFPEETLPYFRLATVQTTKMNVNTLTLNQLRRHPYINFYQAREICDYRRLKGKINDLSQLSLLRDFPPEAIERLRPYVTY